MNLEKVLLANHTKSLMLKVAKYIGEDQKRFSTLMKIALSEHPLLAPRASWAAIHTADKNQKLLNPWIGKMVNHLEKCEHSSVKRNFLRLFENIDIPEKKCGLLVNLCFKFMLSSYETVAVKVFSMTIITNVTKRFPELKNELILVIDVLLKNNPQPSIVARSKRTLKQLSKI